MRWKPNPCLIASLLPLAVVSCGEVAVPDIPGFAPVERAEKAPPLMGGTMLVTRDGAFAVISDPPRDAIHIVDLERWEETGTIALDDDALPFRAAQDAQGRVHVTLRGTGELITLDLRTASIVRRTPVCPNPRGVAYMDSADELYVACAGGLLVRQPAAGGPATTRHVAPDLRDVFVSGERLLVTRFRAAEVLEVAEDGSSALVGAPETLFVGDSGRTPSVAWRTIAGPEGGWIMLHQSASEDPIGALVDGDDTTTIGPWGVPTDCGSAVNPTLSGAGTNGVVGSSGVLTPIALAVDVALSPDGQRVVIASPSQQDLALGTPRISVFQHALDAMRANNAIVCTTPTPLSIRDDITSVAYQPDGSILAQARDEPFLYRVGQGTTELLRLAGPRAADTGFELFHNDTGSSIACAACHPEGTEDGRTWVIDGLGPRRTQPLNIGLEGTAPFHWRGEMDDIHMIAEQIRQTAMGGIEQSEERRAALADWLFSIRPPNPLHSSLDPRVEDGRRLFTDLGCDRCHAGDSFTSTASTDLGHGPLQTPGLRGVALRAPYMHDGRADTLEAAVVEMVESTAPRTRIDDRQVADLVAYLESL